MARANESFIILDIESSSLYQTRTAFRSADMTTSKNQLLLFGEETENVFEQLFDLFRYAKESTRVERFFQLCSSALTKEILGLSIAERDQFPRFTTVIELARANHQEGCYNDVISGVLVCLSQLGSFLR